MKKIPGQMFKALYLRSPFQQPDLHTLLDHAKKHVPYYSRFKDLSFHEIPFLTKEIIRKDFENLKSDDLHNRKYIIKSSGGSTGEPISIIQDLDYRQHQRVVTYEQKSWCGYKFGQPMIHLWGSQKDILSSGTGWKAGLINSLKNLHILNAFRIRESDMKNYLEKINEIRPKLIVTYVQPMYELAKFAERNKLQVRPPGAIMTSAGILYPFIKKKLEEVFQCPVFNRYGTREVGNIACSGFGFDDMRISENNVLVEVVDQNGFPCPDDTEGEIVITSLVNYAMPLIRYKIGDRGILNHSDYDFPVLKKVAGRVTDVFKNPDGELVPAEYFMYILGVVYNRENSWMKRFQVVQVKIDEVIVKIVRSINKVEEKDKELIIDGIKKLMGEECSVTFAFVDEIPLLPSGKYCYAKSELTEQMND